MRARRPLLAIRPGTDRPHTAGLGSVAKGIEALLPAASMRLLIVAVVQLPLSTSASTPAFFVPAYADITVTPASIRSMTGILQTQLLLVVSVAASLVADPRVPCLVGV